MAKLAWALFCEYHVTDAKSGKNSYIGVFDFIKLIRKGALPADGTLPEPVLTPPFVLAAQMFTDPGAPQFTVCVKDSDGQHVLPPTNGRLIEHPEGKHNLHLEFTRGIPIIKSGIYTFEITVASQHIGELQLPVSLDIAEESGG